MFKSIFMTLPPEYIIVIYIMVSLSVESINTPVA